MAIKVGNDPTEEVPLPISVTFAAADTSARAFVTVKPSGPLGCAVNYGADDPNSTDLLYRDPSGASTNWTFYEPGTFTLCGYLQLSTSDTVPLATTGAIPLTVRSARATIALTVPPRVDTGKAFKLSAAVTAELSRRVYVTIKPVGGRGCEASYALDDPNSTDVIYGDRVQGTQTVDVTTTAPSTRSRYLLCAYVQEDSGDAVPEAATSAEFLAGPDPCLSARSALQRAGKSVTVAERSVNRNRASWKRYSAKARSARGYRRRALRNLARRARSRYKSAIRRRAKARARLATAQANVTSACPG